MVIYDKKIVYIDLLKNGNKVKNAGFLRIEETAEYVKWQMRIKGLYETDNGYFDLCDPAGRMLDRILLRKGEGSYCREFVKEMNGKPGAAESDRDWRQETAWKMTGEMLWQVCGIRIALPGGRCLQGYWENADECIAAGEDAGTEEKYIKRDTGEETYEQAAVSGRRAKAAEQVADHGDEEKTLGAAEHTEQNLDETVAEEQKKPAPKPTAVLSTDKWEQLQHMYPTVHPFRDDREFLSITPSDFVILERSYQKMVQNSFLMHGYYNYRHVILGRYQSKGEDVFYLGVPGTYYEQERMAAEMFGFEAFEGKNSPAEPGSFGYYMKQVKI